MLLIHPNANLGWQGKRVTLYVIDVQVEIGKFIAAPNLFIGFVPPEKVVSYLLMQVGRRFWNVPQWLSRKIG